MNYLTQLINKNVVLNIKSWIFVFFIIRLFNITNPPLEVSHNWRQSTVTMVARNFYEVNNNIFYPRLDFDGDKAGVTGMEFPIFNYAIYLFSLLFGYEHWYGRLINLIVTSIGIFFFYKTLKKFFKEEMAFFSSIILLASLWFPFARKIMPDTSSCSLVIIGVFYGITYIEEGRVKNLVFYMLFSLLGILMKIPAGYLLSVFLLFFISKKYQFNRKVIFSVASVVTVIPCLVWYFYWVPHLNKVFDFSHFYMGCSFSEGFLEIKNHLFDTLAKFFDNSLKHIAFFFVLIGLYKSVKNRLTLVFYVFLITFSCFLVFVFKAGFAFHHHNYYVIPFVPVMAFLCAYGILNIEFKKEKHQQLKYVFLIAIALEGVLNYNDDFFIKANDYKVFSLEKDLDRFSDRKDLIVINSDKVPTPMYFAHRKGWITYNDSIENTAYMQKLKRKGLKFIVILKKSFGDEIILEHPVLINNPCYTIYEFSKN